VTVENWYVDILLGLSPTATGQGMPHARCPLVASRLGDDADVKLN
jgi:hypothetical protein